MKVAPGKVYLWILLLLSVLVMGFDLGGSSLHNQDEAKHAVVAREAATQGHWLPLTYNGRPYFSKPPLRIWLTALTFKSVGISELAVRLWSAIFGLGTVLSLFLIGRSIYGERLAFMSALILLTSHQYIYNHCVRTGETDSMLIFCWTCGLLLVQLSVEKGKPRWLYLAAAFLGLTGMVKHLGFVPIVLLIAVGYLVLSGAWRTFSARTWTLASAILLAVALPWHLAMWWIQGKAFIKAYFLGEVVEKRLGGPGGGLGAGGSSQWISLRTMARGFFPWSSLLPFALVLGLGSGQYRRRWSLPIVWLVVALAATVVSSQKFTWYVLPAFPAAAILVAGLLDRFLGDSDSILDRISVVLGCSIAFTSLTNSATHNPFEVMARQSMLSVQFLGRFTQAGWSLLFSAICLLALITLVLLTLHFMNRGSGSTGDPSWLRMMLVAAIGGLAIYMVVAPLKYTPTISPLHAISQATNDHLAEGETLNVSLAGSKDRNPKFRFYFGTKDTQLLRPEDWTSSSLHGELLLTDLATLNEIGNLTDAETPPSTYLARAKGMILLRWPED